MRLIESKIHNMLSITTLNQKGEMTGIQVSFPKSLKTQLLQSTGECLHYVCARLDDGIEE